MSEADYQLGLCKIFLRAGKGSYTLTLASSPSSNPDPNPDPNPNLRPGKGSFLEELKDRDMSEVP